jgi:hypothetical protein
VLTHTASVLLKTELSHTNNEITKIKIAETIIFPTVTYGNGSWKVRKKKRKGKKIMLLSYGRGEEFYEIPRQRRGQTF